MSVRIRSRVRLPGRFRSARRGHGVLCVSDTHWAPRSGPGTEDAPDRLLRVLARFPDHGVFLLGDITESIVHPRDYSAEFANSRRLTRLVRALASRPLLRVVPGNHDAHAQSFLRRAFGARQYRAGGFRWTGLRFLHGHEPRLDLSADTAPAGPLLVPLGRLAAALGLDVRETVASNRAIARRFTPDYVVFGHTHRPEVTDRFANCGAFLASRPRNFLTIDSETITLWEQDD